MTNTYRGGGFTDGVSIQEKALAMSLATLKNDLVVTSLIKNRTEDARDQGSRFAGSVVVPELSAPAATNKTPGTALTYAQASDQGFTLNIDSYKVVPILLEDYGSLFVGTEGNKLSDLILDAIHNLADAIETDVITNMVSGSSRTLGAPSAGFTTTQIRDLRLKSRQDKWVNAKASNIVVGPEGEADLLADSSFTQNQIGGNERTVRALNDAFLSRTFGFNIYTSNVMPSIAGSPGAEKALSFQDDGAAIAFVDMNVNDALPAEIAAAGANFTAMTINDDNGNPAYSMRMTSQYENKEQGVGVVLSTIYGTGAIRDTQLYTYLY